MQIYLEFETLWRNTIMAALIIIIALVGCVVGGIISGLMPIVQSHKAAAMQRKEA